MLVFKDAHEYDIRKAGKRFSLQQALLATLDRSDYGQGQIETIAYDLTAVKDMLVEFLCAMSEQHPEVVAKLVTHHGFELVKE